MEKGSSPPSIQSHHPQHWTSQTFKYDRQIHNIRRHIYKKIMNEINKNRIYAIFHRYIHTCNRYNTFTLYLYTELYLRLYHFFITITQMRYFFYKNIQHSSHHISHQSKKGKEWRCGKRYYIFLRFLLLLLLKRHWISKILELVLYQDDWWIFYIQYNIQNRTMDLIVTKLKINSKSLHY